VSTEHTLDRSLIHHDWDHSHEPVLAVSSGDVVHFDLLMAGHGQVHETSTVNDVVWDFDTIYNLAGPIHVEGASPGTRFRSTSSRSRRATGAGQA